PKHAGRMWLSTRARCRVISAVCDQSDPLRPRTDYYASAHPGPADILLVLEVVDSSLDYDRNVKMRLYARLGVTEFWLVDVSARLLTRFSDPGRPGPSCGPRAVCPRAPSPPTICSGNSGAT